MIFGKSWLMPGRKLSWLFSWAYPRRAKREAEERQAQQLARIEERKRRRIEARRALSDADFLKAMNIRNGGHRGPDD